MKPVKTHTFAGVKHRIEMVKEIQGVTDTDEIAEVPEMMILSGNNIKALHSALHEGLEAIRVCDRCIHDYDNRDDGQAMTMDVARFLWRLGYRKA